MESLKNKFKKKRAPLINVETVAIHKIKFGNPGRGRKRIENCLENDQACSRTHRNLPHSLPIGEDDATVAKHHQDMIIEYRKLRPDMNMLIDRQQRSWSMRAKDFDGSLRTVDLKAKYPWLCSAQLHFSEMKLRFGKDLGKELHQRMKGMEDKILSLVKLKCKDNFVSEIFAEIECEINESTKRDATFNGAILFYDFHGYSKNLLKPWLHLTL